MENQPEEVSANGNAQQPQNILDFPVIFNHFCKQLDQESLNLDDLMKLRLTNTRLNHVAREIVLSKTNKSITVGSDEAMKEYFDKCDQIAPDIVRRLILKPVFVPDSYLRPRSKLCPTISTHIRELTLNNYEVQIEKLWTTLAQSFPNLSVLQIRIPNLSVPTELLPQITTLKLEMGIQRAMCTSANLIPFLQGLFKTLPNLEHLYILEVQGRSFIETMIWDLIVEQGLATLGISKTIKSLHRESPVPIPFGRKETFVKYLGLKDLLDDLKLNISFREDEISIPFIHNWLEQMDSKITTLRLLDGTEQMIPNHPSFGSNITELVLQQFTGCIKFIRNLHKLESIRLVGIDLNTQLYENGAPENDAEERKIVRQTFGQETHPNLTMIKAFGCEGGVIFSKHIPGGPVRGGTGMNVQNHPWLL